MYVPTYVRPSVWYVNKMRCTPLLLVFFLTHTHTQLSVLGQSRVLFAGPDQLDSSLEHMRKLISMEATKEQEEMTTVAAVRRQVQAKYPGTFIPEMPAEMAKEKVGR